MPNIETTETRYHAEVSGTIEGREVSVTVFAGSLDAVLQDIGIIVAQFQPGWKSPARPELANAELKAKQAAKAEQTGEIPVCQNCGTDDFMDLIKWIDKVTLKPKQAWKCQQCGKWARNKNGKGK